MDESHPLLISEENSDDIKFIENEKSLTTIAEIKIELVELIKITIPVIAANFFTYIILTESIVFCGQISKYHLDGASLAISMLNMFCYNVCIGFCTACDTYFSQIFGSKHRNMMGLILQRSLLIVTLFPIILIGIILNLKPIFGLIGQDAYVSSIAAEFLTYYSPGIFFAFYYLIFVRFMQNQNKPYPPLIIGIIANLINIALQFIFVHYLKYGVKASAICQAITYFCFTMFQIIYIWKSNIKKETWTSWSKDSFANWGDFMKLGIIGALLTFLDSFCFEINTILAGIMGPVDQAIMTIITQTENIIYMLALGVTVAVNIRVGQNLGGGNPRKALLSYRCGILLFLCFLSVSSIVYLNITYYIPMIYTNDEVVLKEAREIIPYMVLMQIVDGCMSISFGALKGCGRQRLCLIIVGLGLYCVGLPLGSFLGFGLNLRVKGIWIGLTVALALQLPPIFIYLNFIQDWKVQAEKAHHRIKAATVIRKLSNNEYEANSDIDTHQSNKNIRGHQKTKSTDIRRFSGSEVIVIDSKLVNESKYYSKIIRKRILLFGFAILVLITGICIRVFVTFPDPITNSTIYNITKS